MSLPVDYSPEQSGIISDIQANGLYKGAKTRLLVLMATNHFYRQDTDLASILSEYPGMPSAAVLLKQIHICHNEGLLKSSEIDNGQTKQTFYYMDESCLQNFLSTLPESIQTNLRRCRASYLNSTCVSVLGLLSGGAMGGYLNSSFHLLLQEAQKEILLPMLNTNANPEVLKILKDRAQKGVTVKILLPDFNKVVKKIRNTSEDATQGWIKELKDVDNIEIRIFSTVEDALIYSSVIIDGTICRICVFDHRNEKSSNGTLIEVRKPNYDLNLIKIMIGQFNDIWLRSKPVNQSSWKRILFSKHAWLGIITGLGIAVYNFASSDSFLREVASNVSIGCGSMLIGLSYEYLKDQFIYWYDRFRKMSGGI